MGIRLKTLLIVGSTFTILVVSLATVSHYVVIGGFATLEEEDVRINIERFKSELDNVFNELERTAVDWACRDDTYLFAEGRNDRYLKENLTKGTLDTFNINLMLFTNRSGKVLYAAFRDSSGKELQTMAPGVEEQLNDKPPGEIVTRILSTKKLTGLDMARNRAEGFIMCSGTPLFVSSRAIVKNNLTGPANGTLVIARFFDDSQVQRFSKVLHLSVDLLPAGDKRIPDTAAAILTDHTRFSPPPVIPLNKERIAGYTLINEVGGKAAFVGRISMLRKVYGQGVQTESYYVLSLLFIGTFFTVMLIVLLNRTIITPLTHLSNEVNQVTSSGNISGFHYTPGRDELGSLAQNIENMLKQLKKARNQLMETYYHSGMAEMASGTLHNIRNTISPILVQTVLLRDNLLNLPFDHFKAAEEELKEESLPEDRRNALNHLMTEGNRNLLSIMHGNAEELGVLIERIRHIENILQDNQEYADYKRPEEVIPLEELVIEAAKHFIRDHKDQLSIQVTPELSRLKPITGHHLLLRQVLDNVLINAAEAIHHKGISNGEITIQAYADELNGQEAVHIEIADNGAGISPEAFEQIFQRRFTTKQKPSSGLGLHWCSNTVAAMNGKIFAESKGMEHGARFHILMPASG